LYPTQGTNKVYYVIIPNCETAPIEDQKFLLRILCDREIDVVELP